MTIRDAGERDLPALLGIVNYVILNSTAWYEYEAWDPERLQYWFAAKQAGGWPLLVADDGGSAIGFASFGIFRDRPAYARTIEHSVYIADGAQGRGIGRRLLEALINEARQRELHTMIGGVDAANAGSLAFHRALGFTEAGRLREVGWKFGRWLDLIFMQKML